jgi:hypothetical protein
MLISGECAELILAFTTESTPKTADLAILSMTNMHNRLHCALHR